MTTTQTMPRPGRAFSPVLTPFRSDLSADAARLSEHCRWLLGQGVGLAVFGTTSEGNSLSLTEKLDLLDALAADGIDLRRAMPGTGTCALGDTVALTRRAVELGCHGVLMLPPFYYKAVTADGLYAYFSEVIQRVADARLRIFLYHIPPVSGVALPLPLLERLRRDYPEAIAGMKDSGGDWNFTAAVLDALSGGGFEVYCGSEKFLLDTMRRGGAGCISATANVNPAAIASLCRGWRDADAAQRQARLDAVRAVFEKRPMIAGIKTAVAHFRDDAGWKLVRPPLQSLAEDAGDELLRELHRLGFSMPVAVAQR